MNKEPPANEDLPQKQDEDMPPKQKPRLSATEKLKLMQDAFAPEATPKIAQKPDANPVMEAENRVEGPKLLSTVKDDRCFNEEGEVVKPFNSRMDSSDWTSTISRDSTMDSDFTSTISMGSSGSKT